MPPRYLKKGSAAENSTNTLSLEVGSIVKEVIDDIRQNGDDAVRKYSEKFDKWSRQSFKLSKEQIDAAITAVPKHTIEDIRQVQANVRQFAQAQRDSIRDFELETQPLLERATPPIAGQIPNSTVAAMHMAGADEIFILGGIQAVAAMAIGTETIRKVDFIAGPGNAFVAEGKRQLFGEIGIDLFAGPTEILIITDETADPFTVATDILSQAEHGPDSPGIILTTSEEVGRKAIAFIDELLKELPTAPLAGTSWKAYGEVIVVDSIDEAWKVADEIASEHVQVFTRNPRDALEKMSAYGALFLGENTCVSYGDKYTGGLWVGKFLRTCTYQEVKNSEASGELGRLCGRAARAENFEGHARSGDLRAQKYLKDEYSWIRKAGGPSVTKRAMI
ncbi:hypothetical protein SNOG_07871 [Parastagonospora nodorum SN15]|uniref:Histidinol dehydrogenase n=1 Tax=Phaeosphaeria nodorum (strain SN15 / ATCC MYA-4574 / FGSC 10173) TaxID=321614 RepID=Q0UK43_PHANO|nr:hypothetical protein SNOG_07871 [Parastagonospora nodorum SN15]EAT85337.2 hypothetical protein SNOG_07871 [Parastagonospora nodorum SN15]